MMLLRTPDRLGPLARRGRIFAARRRRLLAAGCTAIAAVAALSAVQGNFAAFEGVSVLVARHDLAPGRVLRGADLLTIRIPSRAVPDGVLVPGSAAEGRQLAGGVRRGEVLTDVRLAGRGLLATVGEPGSVAMPIRLADVGVAALLRPGDRVDVWAAGPVELGSQPAALLASDALVLALPTSSDPSQGALVVLNATRHVAGRLAAAAGQSRLSVGIHGSGDAADRAAAGAAAAVPGRDG